MIPPWTSWVASTGAQFENQVAYVARLCPMLRKTGIFEATKKIAFPKLDASARRIRPRAKATTIKTKTKIKARIKMR